VNLAADVLAVLALAVFSPFTLSAERRVKAWIQGRRGPGLLQPYRDLRRLLVKRPLAPDTATPLWVWAPLAGAAAVVAAAFVLPLADAHGGLGGSGGFLVLGLLLAFQRFMLVAHGHDTATAFGGLGASRELFLGGLAEPALLLVAGGVAIITGSLAVPAEPLSLAEPATWLLAGALIALWITESARIPFDNPATHLELTMVHEAMVLEANGWVLAVQEATAALKQTILAALLVVLLAPLPPTGATRVVIVIGVAVAASAVLAVLESLTAKARLFRAAHFLVAAAFLAFLGSTVALLGGPGA